MKANEMQNDIAKFKTTSLGQDKNSNFAPAQTQNPDLDEYERTVGDLTFAHNVARDYFNDFFICGWGGDYGDRAVHIKTCIPRLRFEDKDHPTRSRARHKKWKDESRLGRSGPR